MKVAEEKLLPKVPAELTASRIFTIAEAVGVARECYSSHNSANCLFMRLLLEGSFCACRYALVKVLKLVDNDMGVVVQYAGKRNDV
jgi:hypothetical protein